MTDKYMGMPKKQLKNFIILNLAGLEEMISDLFSALRAYLHADTQEEADGN